MSVLLRAVLMERLDELRHEPIDKRIRAMVGGATVVDSTRALLVWEPRRVVPTYAVPVEDCTLELIRTDDTAPSADDPGEAPMGPILDGRPVLDPSVPFAVRTTPGRPALARAHDRTVEAFLPDDPDLAGHVILDFDGFDAWLEEDEPNVGHPRDPFHRIDIVHSSRHVRVTDGDVVLAESRAARMLFEPPLPVRCYLPADDVRLDLLQPSGTRSTCAYKGHATYWATTDGRDVAWTYDEPLREAAEVAGRIAFFNERVDIAIDGQPLGRPVTPWSP